MYRIGQAAQAAADYEDEDSSASVDSSPWVLDGWGDEPSVVSQGLGFLIFWVGSTEGGGGELL